MKRRIEDNFNTLIKLLALGFIVAMFALMTNIALAKTLHFNQEDTIVIEGQIGRELFGQAADLVEMVKGKKQFNLVISSPGGSIVAGMIFIEAMNRAQEKGTKFVCVVDKMALSMGFVILSVCDDRYIMDTSLLLWHPARTGMNGYATAKSLRSTAKQLEIYNEYIDSVVKPSLNISDKMYKYYGDNDMILTGVHMMRVAPRFSVIVNDFIIKTPKKDKK